MEPLKRILLVEDDPDIQLVTRLVLETGGSFEVAVSGSGEDALQRAPRFRPQLILLDVMLPDMDGIATFGALRHLPETADVPVIFLTARAEKKELEEYRALEPLGIIIKPFEPSALVTSIRRLWDQRLRPS